MNLCSNSSTILKKLLSFSLSIDKIKDRVQFSLFHRILLPSPALLLLLKA